MDPTLEHTTPYCTGHWVRLGPLEGGGALVCDGCHASIPWTEEARVAGRYENQMGVLLRTLARQGEAG